MTKRVIMVREEIALPSPPPPFATMHDATLIYHISEYEELVLKHYHFTPICFQNF